MQLTASQLQSNQKALIEALKQGEHVKITYHDQMLGIVYPVIPTNNAEVQQTATNDFWGLHKGRSTASVEVELRTLRKGQRGLLESL